MDIKNDWEKIREYPDQSTIWKNSEGWFSFCNPLSFPQHSDSDIVTGDTAIRWIKIADEIESAVCPE